MEKPCYKSIATKTKKCGRNLNCAPKNLSTKTPDSQYLPQRKTTELDKARQYFSFYAAILPVVPSSEYHLGDSLKNRDGPVMTSVVTVSRLAYLHFLL